MQSGRHQQQEPTEETRALVLDSVGISRLQAGEDVNNCKQADGCVMTKKI